MDPRPHKRFRAEDKVFNLHGATFVEPPPGPLAVRLTSALGRVLHSGLDLTKNGEPGFTPHDFPWKGPKRSSSRADPSPAVMGDSRFMAVKELASNDVLRTVPKDRMVSFLVVVVDPEQQLYIPSTSFFDLAINKMEAAIIDDHEDLFSFFWSSSKWRGCGFVELAAEENLEQWRCILADLELDGGLKLDSFPKESLLVGPDITVLLKEPYLTYDIERIGLSLVCRNKALRGGVRVVCSKLYQIHDITRHSISMDGWKMVYLAADCIFMEFLSRCPISQRFHMGPSTVVLRGGIRKPAFLSEQARAQYTWTRSTSMSSSSSNFSPPAFLQPDPLLDPLAAPGFPEPSTSQSPPGAASTPAPKTRAASARKSAAQKPKNRSERIKAQKSQKSKSLPPCC